jgi:hypothetical protein
MSKSTGRNSSTAARPIWPFYAALLATLLLIVVVLRSLVGAAMTSDGNSGGLGYLVSSNESFFWLMLLPILFSVAATFGVLAVRSSRFRLLLAGLTYVNVAVMAVLMLHYCLLSVCQ